MFKIRQKKVFLPKLRTNTADKGGQFHPKSASCLAGDTLPLDWHLSALGTPDGRSLVISRLTLLDTTLVWPIKKVQFISVSRTCSKLNLAWVCSMLVYKIILIILLIIISWLLFGGRAPLVIHLSSVRLGCFTLCFMSYSIHFWQSNLFIVSYKVVSFVLGF